MRLALALAAALVLAAVPCRAGVGNHTHKVTTNPTPVTVGDASGRVRLTVYTLDSAGAFCGPLGSDSAEWAPVTTVVPLEFGADVKGRNTAEETIQCKATSTPVIVYAVDQGNLLPPTSTVTATPTITATPTAANTSTRTATPTATPTATSTRTSSPTFTPTRTPTLTGTWSTQTPTQTPTNTPTPTRTPTVTP